MKQQRVSILGVINVSPESFYAGSIKQTAAQLRREAKQMERDGADAIDVGAMSTAPYLKTHISELEEAKRLRWAIRILTASTTLPISADTSRFGPAEAALEAGAKIINDITGLHGDPRLGKLVRHAERVILMAHPLGLLKRRAPTSPISGVTAALRSSLKLADEAKISPKKLILDPGIGFFRDTKWPWWQWDIDVLRHLKTLGSLNSPILIGVSRKSFLGKILNQKDPSDRLPGSLAATTLAIAKGATWVRTHDVKATRDAVSIVNLISE